jgi:hypothetical protein
MMEAPALWKRCWIIMRPAETDDELIHDPRFADPWPGYK